MTVETQKSKVQYQGNGSTTVFPLPFSLLQPAHVQVYLTTGAAKPQFVTTGYAVTGTLPNKANVQFTKAPAAGVKITIARVVPLVQQMALRDGSNFSAPVVEGAFDNIEMQLQQHQDTLDRAIVLEVDDTRNPAEIRDKLIAAADTSTAAAAKACACADTACECAATAVDAAETAVQKNSELKNLSIAVDDAPYGHMMSAGYNAKTGMLTFRIPEGKAGKDGQNGKNGTDGTDGVQGPAGPKGPQGEQGEMGGSPLPMAFGQFRVTEDGMLALSYSGSIEPEKIAINPTTGELEVYYANN